MSRNIKKCKAKLKKIKNVIRSMIWVWFFGCILAIFFDLLYHHGYIYKVSEKIFLDNNHVFQWTSISAIAAIVALGITWFVNNKSIKANIVSHSRVEWIQKFKKEMIDLTQICYDIRELHEDHTDQIIFFIEKKPNLKMLRDDYIHLRKIAQRNDDKLSRLQSERKKAIYEASNKYTLDNGTNDVDKDTFLEPSKSLAIEEDDLLSLGNRWAKYENIKLGLHYKYNKAQSKLFSELKNTNTGRKLITERAQIAAAISKAMESDLIQSKVLEEYNEKKKLLNNKLKEIESYIKIDLSDNVENNQFLYRINLVTTFLDQTKPMNNVVDVEARQIWNYNYEYLIDLLMGYSRHYLKKEWERIKDE